MILMRSRIEALLHMFVFLSKVKAQKQVFLFKADNDYSIAYVKKIRYIYQ